MKQKVLLGVAISDTDFEEALELIVTGLKKKGKKIFIITPNPEIIIYANKHPRFQKVLRSSDLALPDGIGVIWGAKLLGEKVKKRITGADFVEKLCNEAEKNGFTVGFLGGGLKIAERTAERLLWRYPKLKIAYAASEWEGDGAAYVGSNAKRKTSDSAKASRDKHNAKPQLKTQRLQTNRSKTKKNGQERIDPDEYLIDILFVAFGFPKQEQWIYDNLPKIPVRAAMAVGGSFDYISGAVPRAPQFLRKIGLEWLFRLLVQPWRINRQIALLEFVWLVFKEKFSPASKKI